jgi:hypothetical protein
VTVTHMRPRRLRPQQRRDHLQLVRAASSGQFSMSTRSASSAASVSSATGSLSPAIADSSSSALRAVRLLTA